MLDRSPIAFLGGGNMTEALVSGLLAGHLLPPTSIVATDVLPTRLAHLNAQYGISTTSLNVEAARSSPIVVLSIEPPVLDQVLKEIRPVLTGDHLIVSVVAGRPIQSIIQGLRGPTRVVRAMPNTPSIIRAGITAVTFHESCTEGDRRLARSLFESVGLVVDIEERLMDPVTGLSGSGPAYVFLMIDALADGGVKVGLPRPIAQLLAAQTMAGAAQMALNSQEHSSQLKARVTSPGGTTVAGLAAIEAGRFRGTLIAAIEAATERSKQLGAAEA